MSIVRYEPWSLVNQLHNEVNRLFDTRLGKLDREQSHVVTSDWVPAVDIKEEKDRYIIYADVPGVDPKDIEVTMEKGVLSIRGTRASEAAEEHEGYKRVERSRGTFYRRFTLPDTADAERVSAKGRNGVLEVSIPKAEKLQPRKIAVEA